MRLTINAQPDGFMNGAAARVWLDDVEVSSYTSSVVLTVEADDVIRADLRFYPTALDIDVPVVIKTALREVRQVELSAEE